MKNTYLALILIAALSAPVRGFAHALLVSPAPRVVNGDATPTDILTTASNETGPCDPTLPAVPCASTANPALCTFNAGATIPVTFEAAIQHAGPFMLSLGPAAATSATSQTTFTTLLSPPTPPTNPYIQTEAQNADGTFTEVQKVDVTATIPDVYKEYVVIPTATIPGNYTLQLQQADAPVTYFTCADITIVAAGTVIASPQPSPGPGGVTSQSTGNSQAADGGAKMASCGALHDISSGPGQGPGSASLLLVLPLMLLGLLRLQAGFARKRI